MEPFDTVKILADQAIQFPDLADYKEQIIRPITAQYPDGGGRVDAYQQCVAAHAGQCGVCSQSGAFTPCG